MASRTAGAIAVSANSVSIRTQEAVRAGSHAAKRRSWCAGDTRSSRSKREATPARRPIRVGLPHPVQRTVGAQIARDNSETATKGRIPPFPFASPPHDVATDAHVGCVARPARHEASGAAIRLPRAAALGTAAGRTQPGVGAGPRSVPGVCASRGWLRRVRRCPDRTARRTSAAGGPLRVVPRLRLVVRPAGLRYRIIHHVAPCGPAGRAPPQARAIVRILAGRLLLLRDRRQSRRRLRVRLHANLARRLNVDDRGRRWRWDWLRNVALCTRAGLALAG